MGGTSFPPSKINVAAHQMQIRRKSLFFVSFHAQSLSPSKTNVAAHRTQMHNARTNMKGLPYFAGFTQHFLELT